MSYAVRRDPYPMTSVRSIRNEADVLATRLQLLLESPRARRCYVIVDDPTSGRFVQYCGSDEEGLTLDLPYGQLGLRAVHAVLERPHVSTQYAHQFPCSSITDALELTYQIFRDVHHLPEDRTLQVIYESTAEEAPN